ncbi:MAG: hypothetical protein A3H42_02265 [Deltaproteobacteria bacterium RIFCSPLOWO2_02_FULL_46_8]|nr:MAG: hypothetical protein A3H42_02265 [Deltaproteobacteria bacterium RIFCSPLOWO2_02_FULL_46_8]
MIVKFHKAMDISKECVDVFSWRRVYAMDLEDAVAYAHRQIAKQRAFKALSALKEEEVLKDKIVLDAGCGPGLKSCVLGPYGPKVVIGIDGSQPSIAAAQALSDALHLSNTRFIKGYIEDIPQLLLQAGISKVDFVICSQMIHHTTDWRGNLKIFWEILNKGGILGVSWLDVSSNWGKYMIKNKIAFHLGNSKESRSRIGALLFGRWDRPKKKLPIAWEAFYADRYAAFYKLITVRQMVNTLQRIGFEILESYPCIDWKEWRRQELQRAPSQQHGRILKLLEYPIFRRPFTSIMRMRQFMGLGGDVRVIYCKKIAHQGK